MYIVARRLDTKLSRVERSWTKAHNRTRMRGCNEANLVPFAECASDGKLYGEISRKATERDGPVYEN